MGTNNNLIKRVTLAEMCYIHISGLTEEELEKEKAELIKKHAKKATQNLSRYFLGTGMQMCTERVFFIRQHDCLVLCGVYAVHEKKDFIEASWSKCHLAFDYLLYNEKDGFYLIKNCSGPSRDDVIAQCISPSIYYENNGKRRLLIYGSTYLDSEFKHIYLIYNLKFFCSMTDKIYNIRVFRDSTEIFNLEEVTLFSEIHLSNAYIIYTTEKIQEQEVVLAKRFDVFNDKEIEFLCKKHCFYFNGYDAILSCTIADVDNQIFPVSDSACIYFYISKNATIAYDAIMLCVKQFGSFNRIENLFPEDSSVNYQICFSRSVPKDVINFVFAVIYKSNNLCPVILGHPIHDVVEILCREYIEGICRTPLNGIDETSVNKIIDYIRTFNSGISNEEIIHILAKKYGHYVVARDRYGAYFSKENLESEYLPVSMESVIGEKINGQYVRKLNKSNLDKKWKSEFLLFSLVFSYFPDAIMHYSAPWLGFQHLDVFIPSLSVGIEYQGQQHYEKNDFFGGDEGFEDRCFLDRQKRRLCKENNVSLIEWSYKTPVSPINLIHHLSSCGITDIPIPNPFSQPNSEKKSIAKTEEILQIRQYALDGMYLNTFSSYEEASAFCGTSKSSIQKAVSGYNKTAGDFQWRRIPSSYPIENIDPVSESITTSQGKTIYQISLDGEVVAEFESMTQAERKTGINRKSIRCVLTGLQKTAGGYYWVLKEASQITNS